MADAPIKIGVMDTLGQALNGFGQSFMDNMKDVGKDDPGQADRRAKYYGTEKPSPSKPRRMPNRVPPTSKYKKQELQQGQNAENFRKGAGFPGQQPLIPPTPIDDIDTTQNKTNISTRSHDEEYVQKLSQWGNNEDIKKAADKGFEVGQTYRAGDPMQETPAYIRAGSEEYMNRADMKLWAKSNPAAAKDLQERGSRREARIAAHEERMKGSGEYNNDPEGEADITTAGAPAEWKSKRMGNMIAAVQKGIMETRYGKDPKKAGDAGKGAEAIGREAGETRRYGAELIGTDAAELTEARITDFKDQNPGATREQAQSLAAGMNNAKPISRVGSPSSEVPEEAIDAVMEENGMKRNQAVDVIRSEQPMAHLELGKSFTNPGINRDSTFRGNQRAHLQQATMTGTNGMNRSMQPSSGLNDAQSLKAPLKYQQGNIYERSNADTQEAEDHVSPDRFLWERSKDIGQHMFGEDYSPTRPMPGF